MTYHKQFYLTLPSNSQVSNTAASFETKLPRNITLNGEWEVGLAEIIYANTWHNVSFDQNKIKFQDLDTNTKQTIRIPAAKYVNIIDLVSTISQAITNHASHYADYIKFSYNDFSKLCEVTIDSKHVESFIFSRHLQYMLGFNEKQNVDYTSGLIVSIKAQHPPDMFGGLHYLYTYCDVIEPQIVGNIFAPLLQVINVQGKYMEITNHSYITPHYIPVLKKSFNSIEINIKNDLDQPVPFEFGKTIVKLHFRMCL